MLKIQAKLERTRNKVLTKFYFCKEKWVLGSPSTHFQSFSNISLFSKILKSLKLFGNAEATQIQ